MYNGVNTVENMNIKCISDRESVVLNITKPDLNTLGNIELNNIKIDAYNLLSPGIRFECGCIPTFKNVIFNCKNGRLYIDASEKEFENEIIKSLNILLDQNYNFNLYHVRRDDFINKKANLKNVVAASKNKYIDTRHYRSSELFKLKPGANIKSLFKDIPTSITRISISFKEMETIVFDRNIDQNLKKRYSKISQDMDDGWTMIVMDL